MVILDLEDGVAPADKATARQALRRSELDPSLTMVRLNPSGTPDHALDLETLAATAYDVVLLAKAESSDQVVGLSPLRIVALCETPLGVLAAGALAACASTVALMWGAEDLVAGLGGSSSRYPDGQYRDVARNARSQVLLAAGAFGVAAIDAVHLDINDLDGLQREASDAAASGFVATACIHPSQVPVVREAYRPSDEEVAWARRVVAGTAGAGGVFSLDGKMIDAPLLRHARRVLERADPGPHS